MPLPVSPCQPPAGAVPRPRSGLKVNPAPASSPHPALSARPPGIHEFHMKYCALPSPPLPPAPELPEGSHSLHIAQATSKPDLGFVMYIIYIFVYFLNPAVMGCIINVAQGWAGASGPTQKEELKLFVCGSVVWPVVCRPLGWSSFGGLSPIRSWCVTLPRPFRGPQALPTVKIGVILGSQKLSSSDLSPRRCCRGSHTKLSPALP